MSVEHTVAHDDRGLAYGDGVFETMAATGGVVLALDRHLQRMASGCRRLGFEPPPMDAVRRASAAAVPCTGRCVIKLLVTRGRGGRGYRPPEAPEPTLRVSCHPWPQHVDLARRQGIVAWRLRYRLGHNPALAGLKHLNRLDQVLAAAELAHHAQAQEGIVCDLEGRPVCGVMSNLFLVRDGALITPCLRRCGVNGIIRGAVIELARSGALPPLEIRDLEARELDEADEIFLTNSVRGLSPVIALETTSPRPRGPVAAQAQRALLAAELIA